LPEKPETIECFEDSTCLNEQLDKFCEVYFKEKVNINMMNGEIILPKVLETYKADFGGSDESVLKIVFKFFE
jgi:hypothetical protein